MSSERLTEIYDLLYKHFGPQQWWPGQTRTEVILGAILTQNTNWANVEKALNNLRKNDCLDFERINSLDQSNFAEMIRPAGYYNIKAKRIKNFTNWLHTHYDGQADLLSDLNTHQLREELLSINGIGMETADSILLYAFEKPIFVVDTYTCRVLARHNLIDTEFGYQQVQEFFEYNLPQDVKLFNEFHALFVCLGKNFCKPNPKCQQCPLNCLPHSIEEY